MGLRYDQVLVVAWIADDCTLWLTGAIRRVAWKVVREGVGNTEDRSASGRADFRRTPSASYSSGDLPGRDRTRCRVPGQATALIDLLWIERAGGEPCGAVKRDVVVHKLAQVGEPGRDLRIACPGTNGSARPGQGR